jgi:hypothetical protein
MGLTSHMTYIATIQKKKSEKKSTKQKEKK